MLLVVCVCAFVSFVWVMAVGVGVSGFWWCCFQWWVAVVWESRRVPVVVVGLVACSGVAGLVPGVSGVCAGVGVVWLVWFRMLTCFGLFPVFWLCLLFVWLITLSGRVGLVWCVLVRGLCSRVGGLVRRAGCVSCVCGAALGSCGRVCGFVWLLGCCPCCW